MEEILKNRENKKLYQIHFRVTEKERQRFYGNAKKCGLTNLNIGSLPLIVTRLGSDMELSVQYLEGIYNTIIVKDVVTRKGVSDVTLLKNIVKFLCSNAGSSISTANITDYI